MRWDPGHESPDVVDRRGQGGGGGMRMGWLMQLLPLLVRHPAALLLILLVVAGSAVFRAMSTPHEQAPSSGARTETNLPDEPKHFVAFVLDDAQSTWAKKLAARGREYRRAKLVLFTGETPTACGFGAAATGPFYCPQDERVYIDLSFYDELAQRLGARGDFAQAYVIAHEIGHHVQNLLGEAGAMRNLRPSERRGASSASVRVELQADCFAGVWAHSARERGLLEPGDVEEALGAASAIGDDRLQRETRGRVSPETFTHGTAEQRSRWFRTGLDRGEIAACDTFHASPL